MTSNNGSSDGKSAQTSANSNSGDNNSETFRIIGAIIGVVLAVIVVASVIITLVFRKSKNAKNSLIKNAGSNQYGAIPALDPPENLVVDEWIEWIEKQKEDGKEPHNVIEQVQKKLKHINEREIQSFHDKMEEKSKTKLGAVIFWKQLNTLRKLSPNDRSLLRKKDMDIIPKGKRLHKILNQQVTTPTTNTYYSFLGSSNQYGNMPTAPDNTSSYGSSYDYDNLSDASSSSGISSSSKISVQTEQTEVPEDQEVNSYSLLKEQSIRNCNMSRGGQFGAIPPVPNKYAQREYCKFLKENSSATDALFSQLKVPKNIFEIIKNREKWLIAQDDIFSFCTKSVQDQQEKQNIGRLHNWIAVNRATDKIISQS